MLTTWPRQPEPRRAGRLAQHEAHGLAGAVDHPFEVDVDLQLDVAVGQLRRVARPQHPGDVAAEVEPAEAFLADHRRLLPALRRGHVEPLQRHPFRPAFRRRGPLEGREVDVGGEAAGAVGGQRGGEGPADARGGAGDQEYRLAQGRRH